jgi:hypothetical protein
MKRNINCPCGRNFTAETEDEIDLDKNPEYLDKISSGTFMSFDCPDCGKKHKPEYKLMITWRSEDTKLEVLPELDRGEFYRRKDKKASFDFETVIGYPEMADRLAVIKDGLEPIIIETLKYYLLVKAEENYPDKDINAWYCGKTPSGIEFHLDGIRPDEVAVMVVPEHVYAKTLEDYNKHSKNDTFTSLRCRSYLSVQNMFRADALK